MHGYMDPNSIPVVVVESDSSKRLYLAGLFSGARTCVSLREVPFDHSMVLILGPSLANDAKVLDTAEMILISSPDVTAVLVTPGDEVPTEKMQWALRSNVKGVVPYEGSSEELRSAVNRARQLLATSLAQKSLTPTPILSDAEDSDGKIIAVFSPKGGVGKSTISTNLAVQLAKSNPDITVALLDADMQFGDVAIMLRISHDQNMISIMESKDRINPSTYDYACSVHSSGLRVLPAPPDPAQADKMDPDALGDVLKTVRKFANITVVDTSGVLDEETLTILENADHILMPVQVDLPTVKNVAIGLKALKAVGVNVNNVVTLVLNRHDPDNSKERKEVEKTLKCRVSAVIPDDPEIRSAVNDAMPVVMQNPKAPSSRAFAEIAESFYSSKNTSVENAPKKTTLKSLTRKIR